MTNTSELEAAIARSGKSKNDLASKLGLASCSILVRPKEILFFLTRKVINNHQNKSEVLLM